MKEFTQDILSQLLSVVVVWKVKFLGARHPW